MVLICVMKRQMQQNIPFDDMPPWTHLSHPHPLHSLSLGCTHLSCFMLIAGVWDPPLHCSDSPWRLGENIHQLMPWHTLSERAFTVMLGSTSPHYVLLQSFKPKFRYFSQDDLESQSVYLTLKPKLSLSLALFRLRTK